MMEINSKDFEKFINAMINASKEEEKKDNEVIDYEKIFDTMNGDFDNIVYSTYRTYIHKIINSLISGVSTSEYLNFMNYLTDEFIDKFDIDITNHLGNVSISRVGELISNIVSNKQLDVTVIIIHAIIAAMGIKVRVDMK